MMTATNRNVGDERSPMRVLANSAYSGGIDWDLRLMRKRYAVAGYFAGTTINGTEAAIARLQENNVHSFQRPDATHVEFDPTRTTLSGQSGFLAFRKISGARVRFESNIGFKSPGFDSNDLGFIRRADQISQNNWLQWRHDKPGKYIRSFRFNINQWGSQNFDGDRLSLGGNVNAHWSFKNNWGTGFGINRERGSFDDRATRGGPGANYDAIGSFWSYVNTDDRKPVAFDTFIGGGYSEFGPHFFNVNPGLTFRPLPSLSISGGFRFNKFDQDAQWVTNEESVERPDALRVRAASTSGPSRSRRASTTRCRRRCRSRSTRSHSSRPAPTRTTRSSSTAARTTGSRATRRTRMPVTPTSTIGPSGPPTSCDGNTARARASSSSGSRAAKRTRRTVTSASAATSAASSAPRPITCSW